MKYLLTVEVSLPGWVTDVNGPLLAQTTATALNSNRYQFTGAIGCEPERFRVVRFEEVEEPNRG